MATVRALDALHDWQFGRGLQSYKSDLDALKQSVQTRLMQWQNNCFFAMDEGVDWANELDIGMKDALDSDIKRTILKTTDVLRIDNYSSTLDASSRAISISCEIRTNYGDIALEETV
jgi:hypothetical protein